MVPRSLTVSLQGAEVLFYQQIGWHPQEKEQYGEKPAWRLDECDETMPLQMFMLQQQTVLV
jgi:hypothetical protein